MSDIDRSMALLFIAFLAFFLAAGLLPAWARSVGRLKAAWRSRPPRRRGPGAVAPPPPPATPDHDTTPLLNDCDSLALLRLAEGGGRGLSRRRLQDALHFDAILTRATLASLLRRGLVQTAPHLGFGRRYRLSARGRDHARAQGYLPATRPG